MSSAHFSAPSAQASPCPVTQHLPAWICNTAASGLAVWIKTSVLESTTAIKSGMSSTILNLFRTSATRNQGVLSLDTYVILSKRRRSASRKCSGDKEDFQGHVEAQEGTSWSLACRDT